MNSEIRDINLAPSGEQKIEWVERNCDLLRNMKAEFEKTKPFEGLKISLSIHLEAKTAYLCKVLKAGGAEMYVAGSNPLSTQDDVAAALAADGMEVHAVYGATPEEYARHTRNALKCGPNIIIDDGGDLVNIVHNEMPEMIPDIIGGCEETTTGIIRLEAMNKAGALKFPMVKVNNACCKHFFDNRYGTGQSAWDGFLRTTNLIVAGKVVVISGYGWCGKGTALRAKGLGARVIVTEVNPIAALEAVMDGYDVMPMREAAKVGDIFITVTGCDKIIGKDHFLLLKDGAILSNAGHFDAEIDMAALREMAVETKDMRHNIKGYLLPNGRWVFVLGEGRLLNLACADGHPAEIMDMSFAIQALSAKYLVEHQGKMTDMLIDVPYEIDLDVASRKLAYWGKEIDSLTDEQETYLNSYNL